ncbi:MAG TPA: metalloregulator ArsR/SmtB family transcription factor [Caulobacteraceae bacterium]|jgi:DNA-binding transcriptional ArsR family regulator|nr:metalloregulator ArsR/SmtB family transcription factor [Caulobacteraceae bacterium]
MVETDVFKALGDPTRRAVLDRLSDGERSVAELTAGLPVSQPAVSQHLAALKAAGLVGERRDGRKVFYRIEPQGLAPLLDWLGRYRAFWPARIERLKDILKEMDQ